MVLDLRAIQKSFGGVHALRKGNLAVRAGEVHLLLGENGAGKSTLMKVAAGLIAPDSGEFRWKGERVSFANPAQAQRAGISMVHQESLLAPHLTVAENIYLGHELMRGFGLVDRRGTLKAARELIATHGFPLQADWVVGRLSPAGRQLVEICRAIAHGSSLLIFDEPTSALSTAESQQVFRIVRALRERGAAVIYITHRMEELRALGDRVTVLRDGETVFAGEMNTVSTDGLIRHMVGRAMAETRRRQAVTPGAELMRVEGLTRAGVLENIDLTLRAGEIVGLAGLVGAGRTELCRCLFGIDPVTAGRIVMNGREVRLKSPRDAVRAGVALIPEDRQRNGLAAGLPVSHNMLVASMDRVTRFGFASATLERETIARESARLRLKASSPSQLAGRLSGGNQQKVVLAKWALSGARVFLFDEPARGIDVAAKAEVFELMDQLAREGAAILMVSSELPELIQVADRIVVMRQGRIAGELSSPAAQEEILRLAALETAQ